MIRPLLARLAGFPHWVAVGFLVMGLVMLLVTQCERRVSAEEKGELRAENQRLRGELARLQASARRVDTQYVRDTVKLGAATTRWRTLLDSIRVTDTLTVRESVIVAAADTAIRACRQALTTCEQRVAVRDSLLAHAAARLRNDAALHRAELARVNPRMLPFVEAHTNPLDTRVFAARAGVEARFLGQIRLSGAAQYHTQASHPFAVLFGARVTF